MTMQGEVRCWRWRLPREAARRMSCWTRLGLSLGALAALAPAAAQAQRVAPEVVACAGANRVTYGELIAAHESDVRRHAMHPVVVTRLQGLRSQLVKLREATVRNPRNLAECEQTGQSLAAAREQLERIVGSPAQVAECVAANQQSHVVLLAALTALQAGEAAAPPLLQSAAARLEALRGGLAREGGTLADCRQLSAELGDERTQLQRLAPPPAPQRSAAASAPALAPAASAPSPAACRETQARTYNEVAQSYARLVNGGPIAAEWMAPLQSLSERLTRLHASIADASAPGWDCDAVARALAQARSDLAQLVRR